MNRRLEKAMDHLILLHKIEENKAPSPKLGKAVGLGIFLLGIPLAAGVLFNDYKQAVNVNAVVTERKLPICSVETEEPVLAFTFDLAWGNADLERILTILKDAEIRATFFVTGTYAEQYPDEVRAIYAAGQELGSHGDAHRLMSSLSDSEKEEEILNVHKKVKDLTGYEMFLFRPPYGDYDNDVLSIAEKCGYMTIQWNVDSRDWRDYGKEAILSAVLESEHLGKGSIILFHNDTAYLADTLEELIEKLKKKGYGFVPVSELIYRDQYHMDPSGKQIPD